MARLQTLAGDQTLSSAPSHPFITLCFPGRGMLSLKLQRQSLHMGVDLPCLLAGRNGSSEGQSPACPPPATAPIWETPTLIRNHSIWGLVSPGPLPTAEVPPPPPGTYSGLLGQPGRQHGLPDALCRAEAQKQQETQSPKDLSAAVSHPEAGGRVSFCTSDLHRAGRGEEARGVKREEGPQPGWGLREEQSFACSLGPPQRVPGILVPSASTCALGGGWSSRLFLVLPGSSSD